MDSFTGFDDKDFDVFTIEGLDERMDALKSTIRPKLDFLGQHFSPLLSNLTGTEIFPHVAKHARRTINPPDDTWVAFANSKRGYKKLPHFQIGLWGTHLFVWFAIIYESPIKSSYADVLNNHIEEIQTNIPQTFVWSMDHTKPDATAQSDITSEDFANMIDRLRNVKKAEILCGLHIDKSDPILKDGDRLLKEIEHTFQQLQPLYNLSLNIDL